MIASRDASVPLASACFEDLVAAFGADVENRAHRLALDLRLVVVEQLGQIGQRVAAAELAQQVDGRAANGRIRRALQPFDGPACRRRRRRSGSRSAARAAAAALRPTALRRAACTTTSPSDRHIAFTRSNCASSIVGRCVAMWRIIGPATSMSMAVTACWRRPSSARRPPACVSTPTSCSGGVEIADEQQVLDQRDDRRHQLAPAIVVLLDAQQVEHQRQVERPQRRSWRPSPATR